MKRILEDRYTRYALISQALLVVYFQLVAWVPLGQWNRQRCCPAALDLALQGKLSVLDALFLSAFALPLLVFVYGAIKRSVWLLALALSFYVVWLALQLLTFWPPYIFGASERWKLTYERAFSSSTQVLPSWGDHLPPDGMHLVLQILLVAVVWLGCVAVVRKLKESR